MDIYIPSISFGEQYPAFASLRPLVVKLLAEDCIREKGCILFVDGKVTELKALPEKNGFEATVSAEKTYSVTVQVKGASTSKFKWSCGCIRGNKSRPCEHSFAVLAALVYIFREHNYISLAPLLANVNHLAAQIDQSPKHSSKHLRRIRFRGMREKAPYIEGDAPLSSRFTQAVNPYREISRMASNTLELSRSNAWPQIEAILTYARQNNLKLEGESGEDSLIQISTEPDVAGTRSHFIACQKTGSICLEQSRADFEDADVIAGFDTSAVLLTNGKICKVDNTRHEILRSAYAKMQQGFSEFSRPSNCLPVNSFNAYSLRLTSDERKLLRQADFSYGKIIKGRPDTVLPAKLPETPLEIDFTLELKSDSVLSRRGLRSATVEGRVGQYPVNIGGLFEDFSRRLALLSDTESRFLGSRMRVSALLDAVVKLPLIKKKQDRLEFIELVTALPTFTKKPEHTKVLRKFLRQLEADYCRAQSAQAPLLIPSETREFTWQNVRLPLPALLSIAATLYACSNFMEILGYELEAIPISDSSEVLHQVAEICQTLGVQLLFDSRPIESHPVRISIDAQADDKLDWFELTPEISCKAVTISPEQWEKLLSGSLILKHEGTLIAPRLSKNSGIELLIDQFRKDATRTDNKGSGKFTRLQILDWIEWRKTGIQLNLPKEAEALFKSLLEFDGIPELPLPQGIHATLRPYQKRGFEWLSFLKDHRFGACLADDMGLGKTLQSLVFLTHLKQKSGQLKCLAVVPPSLLFNWSNEANRFCPNLEVAEYAGTNRDWEAVQKSDLILTTYDTMRRDIDRFSESRFDVVLFDEAQNLKNHKSRRTQAARKLRRGFTLCLTGTPMENHLGEYHSIMDLALPGLMGSYENFLEEIRNGQDRSLSRARPFLLRRKKSAILKELPPKVETDRYLDMTEEQKEFYTRVVGEVREEVLSAFQKQTRSQAGIVALAALTRLRQICVSPALLGHSMKEPAPKMTYLCEQIEELRDEGHSALVFSQFRKSLDGIEKALEKTGHTVFRLDGTTPTRKRKELVESFQASEASSVFLISLKAGGVGLNLTRASYVFHVDPWWNPAVENQASDRAHRIGQQQTVFIQRLIMRHTVEEKMMQLKERKAKLFQNIVESQASAKSGGPLITQDDFKYLLEA